jgi:putative hemolysin
MDLGKPKDILKGTSELTNFGGEYFAKFLMYILRFRKLNRIYEKVSDKEGIDFIDEIIRLLEINFEFDPNELNRIPGEGPVIVICNHPFGGLDGILMIKLLLHIRSDVRVLSNYMLKRIEPISGYFLADNPFETVDNPEQVTRGSLKVHQHLLNDGILCIFPSGEYSSYDTFSNISDRQWRYPIIKFIKRAHVPVIPVHFQGSNSRLVNVISKIYPGFKGIKLPTELLNKRNKIIKVRIGNPISLADQDRFNDIYQYGRYLRAKTYSLETQTNLEVKRFFNYSLKPRIKPEEIVQPIARKYLLQEIEAIQKDYTLFNLRNYTVYCVPSRLIPHMLNEIGRLREHTFRDVGEGTNRAIDIDEFDLYYHQMFIWDDQEQKLVGAYRIGMGHTILRQFGKRGFYFTSLFRVSDAFNEILRQSLELGRSFVVRDYQRKPMPLFLLWKGILYFLLKNPEYRYMIGPVSISNNYSKISKDLIISFILKNYFDWDIAPMIRPRNRYRVKADNPNLNILMDTMEKDINKLDKTIGDMDELNTGLPVLLKKYIKLNAKIIGFNVDPKFNNCLDGLIILDVYDVPKNTIESLSKEINDGSLLERFYSNRETE